MSDEGSLGFIVGAACAAKFLTDIGICQVPWEEVRGVKGERRGRERYQEIQPPFGSVVESRP
jgi:hypothetical protein